MLAIERHRLLLDLLQKSGSVRTADAAKALGVTEETVRRDFEKLEAEGTLLRSHGGAVRLEPSRQEVSEEERTHQNIEAKQMIGREALGHIRAGQTILFDASTTARQLAEMLPDQPLTTITNGIRTALILTQKPSIDVIMLGGNIHNNSLSCAGDAAEQALDLIHIDTAFLSCRGFDVKRGPSEASEGQARLKRRIFERADKVFILADASKLGVSSSYFFARPSEITVLITDQKPDAPTHASLQAAGVEILIPNSGIKQTDSRA